MQSCQYGRPDNCLFCQYVSSHDLFLDRVQSLYKTGGIQVLYKNNLASGYSIDMLSGQNCGKLIASVD